MTGCGARVGLLERCYAFVSGNYENETCAGNIHRALTFAGSMYCVLTRVGCKINVLQGVEKTFCRSSVSVSCNK